MSDRQAEHSLPDALKEIYGGRAEEDWESFRKKHKALSQEQLLREFEQYPSCNYSFFLREANIRGLASEISKKQGNNWNVLSVGCGYGPEPYELAMRLVKGGKTEFKIDAIDVSPATIKKAQEGKFTIGDYIGSSTEREFFDEMSNAGVLRYVGERKTRSSKVIEYGVTDEVKSHIAFSVHDIIEGPVLPHNQVPYDLVICNTVLQHYPPWTRQLIVANIMENMKDGALLALEHNEWLNGIAMTPERVSWLEPYYKWKETELPKLGLIPEEITPEGFLLPLTVYRYNAYLNPYKGKNLAIRNMQVIEAK